MRLSIKTLDRAILCCGKNSRLSDSLLWKPLDRLRCGNMQLIKFRNVSIPNTLKIKYFDYQNNKPYILPHFYKKVKNFFYKKIAIYSTIKH